VSTAGRSGTTNSKGKVTLELTAQHSLKAIATDGGYVAASKRIAVGR
jgi:hypothetical protein